MQQALGLLETRGLIGAIAAADAMAKAANIKILSKEKITAAMVTIEITGEVAAVKAAIEAGAVAAQRVGQLVGVHVIARPDDMLSVILPAIHEDDEKTENKVNTVEFKAIPEEYIVSEKQIITEVNKLSEPDEKPGVNAAEEIKEEADSAGDLEVTDVSAVQIIPEEKAASNITDIEAPVQAEIPTEISSDSSISERADNSEEIVDSSKEPMPGAEKQEREIEKSVPSSLFGDLFSQDGKNADEPESEELSVEEKIVIAQEKAAGAEIVAAKQQEPESKTDAQIDEVISVGEVPEDVGVPAAKPDVTFPAEEEPVAQEPVLSEKLQNDEGENKDQVTVDELESLSVHELRRLARNFPDFPIKGRDISAANRRVLIEYFKTLI
jgi:ethanolamine utilization protein EutM